MLSFFGFGKKKSNLSNESGTTEEKGIIGKYDENGLPVIVKFVNEFPADHIRTKYPTLAVVSWKYDGEENNGMPPRKTNQKMIVLEKALRNKSKKYRHAYSRTGNNLKELVYYSTSQDDFMKLLNRMLTTHEKYPIEINFYEDQQWSEFKKLIDDFKNK